MSYFNLLEVATKVSTNTTIVDVKWMDLASKSRKTRTCYCFTIVQDLLHSGPGFPLKYSDRCRRALAATEIGGLMR